MTDIRVEAQIYAQLKDRLLALYPDIAEDDQALLDSLEGECDFVEMAVALFESAENDKLLAAALKERIADMRERLARFDARSDAKRGVLAQAMEQAGVPKIEAAQVTLSLRHNPPAVQITDETALPVHFLVEKVTRTPDKKAIKEALEQGPVAGACLGNGSVSLSARTK